MLHPRNGFTLIELMVVMVIISVLGTIGMLTFRTSQVKARDTKRKNDLQAITRGLESYYNDFGDYPLSDAPGNILGCGDVGSVCLWGESFGGTETTYLTALPTDPVSSWRYVYEYVTGKGYRLYARLENTEDSSRRANGYPMVCDPDGLGVEQYCNYFIASPIVSDPVERP